MKSENFYFYMERELEDFKKKVKGYYTRIYFDNMSKYELILIPKPNTFFRTYHLPELTEDQRIFNNYEKAKKLLKSNFNISINEDIGIRKVISIISKIQFDAEER